MVVTEVARMEEDWLQVKAVGHRAERQMDHVGKHPGEVNGMPGPVVIGPKLDLAC